MRLVILGTVTVVGRALDKRVHTQWQIHPDFGSKDDHYDTTQEMFEFQ